MSNDESLDHFRTELDLITATLLPTERLELLAASGDYLRVNDGSILDEHGVLPLQLRLKDERAELGITIKADWPFAVVLGTSGGDRTIGEWLKEVSTSFGNDREEEWVTLAPDPHSRLIRAVRYPLYQLITSHLLPCIQSHVETPSPPATRSPNCPRKQSLRPARVLFTSHHLLAPSKRRDLASLSHDLRLVGFAKTGHPGVIYAEGDLDDLEAFAREVKSWQWLALRMRLLEEADIALAEKGRWQEVEKIGEAIDWMSANADPSLLTDLGIGAAAKG